MRIGPIPTINKEFLLHTREWERTAPLGLEHVNINVGKHMFKNKKLLVQKNQYEDKNWDQQPCSFNNLFTDITQETLISCNNSVAIHMQKWKIKKLVGLPEIWRNWVTKL